MYPRSFDYVAPTSLDEAMNALASAPGAKVMAGGQSLLPLMKMRLLSPRTIVDIGRLPGLGEIVDGGDHISIGTLVRHAQTASSQLVATHAAALAAAASMTGDTQVRNRGTTCGSLAHSDIAADQPAAVIASGATMVARSIRGTREIAAADFCIDTLASALDPDEILVEIRLPKAGGSSAYDKIGRRGGHSDYAVAGAAAWVRRDNGHVVDARVAVTGVGTRPMAIPSVAAAIIGTDGSEGAVEAAAEHAVDGVTVLEDLYGSEAYKTHLAKVFVARALKNALAAG